MNVNFHMILCRLVDVLLYKVANLRLDLLFSKFWHRLEIGIDIVKTRLHNFNLIYIYHKFIFSNLSYYNGFHI